jgi:hypothetical protein
MNVFWRERPPQGVRAGYSPRQKIKIARSVKMEEKTYNEWHLLDAEVEIEEEYGTLPPRWELEEGLEMDFYYEQRKIFLETMVIERAKQIAYKERMS